MAHDSSDPQPTERRYLYLRHTWPVRLMHWVNVIALLILLMSGLQIFNAHPALYWGESSYSGRPPVLQMGAKESDDGRAIGVTEVLGHEFHTTGVLGLSNDPAVGLVERGFPSWATLPGSQWLAMARRWHFFFAWLLVINGISYVAYSIWSRHLTRDLTPTRTDWRSVGRSVLDHLLFRHPRGEAAKHYNVLQKLAYLGVIFVALPLVILMGLAMSPRIDSLWPGWVDVFGGRQSARTLHFLAATAIVLFVLIHLFEVAVTGLWNNLRSMITGRYEVESEPIAPAPAEAPRAANDQEAGQQSGQQTSQQAGGSRS
jgi:thiosulfate reductase cytochrome b subunit